MDVTITREKRKKPYVAGAAAAMGLIVAAVGLGRLRAAAPTVDRSSVWTDTVREGPMVRQILGQGTLVPEEVRWLAAKSPARVERVLVKPGARVEADTIILELVNSNLQLQALEAERQLAQAQAEFANLQASLNSQRLAQQSVVATLQSELGEARRRARADDALAAKGFLSDLEQGQTKDRAGELDGRLRFEQQRGVAQSKGISAQIVAQRAQLERLRAITAFRRGEVEALRLRAGVSGVLQEMSLQPGQSVAGGALLAKVVQPERLKAELRVPETQAKDVHIGQAASIDTHNGIILGKVSRIDPAAQGGTVRVDVTLTGALPPGARPDLNIEGTIELEKLKRVLYVGRPAFGRVGAAIGLFKIQPDGATAVRTAVKLGRSSAKDIEIVEGLKPGDRVILSDTSQWDQVEQIRLQ